MASGGSVAPLRLDFPSAPLLLSFVETSAQRLHSEKQDAKDSPRSGRGAYWLRVLPPKKMILKLLSEKGLCVQ